MAKKKEMKKTKKKNAQDLTLRNAKSYNKRLEKLEQWCEAIATDLTFLFDYLMQTERVILKRAKRKGAKRR